MSQKTHLMDAKQLRIREQQRSQSLPQHPIRIEENMPEVNLHEHDETESG